MMSSITLSNTICDPSNIKNSTIKKSRKGRNREPISYAYGVTERVTPAIRAPISSEKPIWYNVTANPSPHANENKNSNS